MNNVWIDISKKIKELYPVKDFLPLHEPTFSGNEKVYVNDCIETGWVSSVGKYVSEFEKSLAEYTGVKRAVAVVNGTAALHVALEVAGVQIEDEVLTPSLTFIATANAISYCGAIPHFIDISNETLGVDVQKLASYLQEMTTVRNNLCMNKYTGKIIKAIVPMHTFGHPVDMDPLIELCDRYNIVVVEDAAESLGSFYKGKHTGNFGKISAMSFNGNKIITTGGGGAILTNDDNLADRAKHLTTTAKVPHRWKYVHDEVGYNYRMPNLNAALGVAQLEQLDGFIKNKRRIFYRYEQILKGYEGIQLYKEPSFATSNYWLQTLIIDPKTYIHEDVLGVLNQSGIMARPVWTPLHELEPFKHCPHSDLTVTNKLSKQIINIASSPYLGE
ncbi:LegC family aminotransferase [Terribacillus sp. DMT04]|uniref:LegC family aminotransferase n=1 Tax=Terribacillus sp. DMT04 TaxID=2850441 RepID=UPI001C2BE9AA|nr:LegC family aminotransferase [Terribacillus sp. DMT04]QXE00956.1 LegC family aminotransferase [Terribacillus sp. DMT04]